MGKKGGGGRRRNTAKTGDKALYNQRSRSSAGGKRDHDDDENDKDDAMYDRVDRFHNQRDEYVRLDASAWRHNRDDDESEDDVQAVMDLGVGASSSEEEDEDEETSGSDDDDNGDHKKAASKKDAVLDDDEDHNHDDSSTSSDSQDDELEEAEDVRDWGKRKASYYHGDTTDLEIGQEIDDAFLEEQAAKEIQQARLRELTEDDFALDDEEDNDKETTSESQQPQALMIVGRNVQTLSRKEKQKLLDQQSPEFLPLVTHFTEVVRELQDRTLVATSALLEGEAGAAQAVGATPLGCEYLVTKAMIETASALNLAAYLLLKSEQPQPPQDNSLSSHPVMSRLQKLHKLSSQLESSVTQQVPGLHDQLDKLVQAVALMNGDESIEEAQETTDRADDDQYESNQRETVKGVTGSSDDDDDDDEEDQKDEKEGASGNENNQASSSDEEEASSSSSNESESDEDKEARLRHVLNEARFALRPKELQEEATTSRKRRPALDFGEDDPGEQEIICKKKAFSSTLNSIHQRSNTQSKKSRMAEDLDDFLEREDDFMADEEEEDFPGRTPQARGRSGESDDDERAGDPELEEDGEDDFYSQVARKSQARKEARKTLYQVAPKFPRVEHEIDGERAASRTILKNRGLVPHKNRLNRNPRVKKREQYRKALIRRKGAVREVRKDEGHKYGGEETGIKSGLSRSRKLL